MKDLPLSDLIIADSEWYQYLIDDLKSIVTECEFSARWAVVEKYHAIGKRILEESDNMPLIELCNAVSKELGLSQRSMYHATEFATKYPDLHLLPNGKNVSWHKIVTNLLPEKSRKKKPKPSPTLPETYKEFVHNYPCIKCGKKPVDFAHFPKTEATGGGFGIPLCRKHHIEQGQMGIDTFFAKSKNNLDRYLCDLVKKVFDKHD